MIYVTTFENKNPTYWRQSISRPMQIVAPMPLEGEPRTPENPIFLKNGKNNQKRNNSETSRNMTKLAIRPSTRGLLSIGKHGFHRVLFDKEYPKIHFYFEKWKNHPKLKKHLEICQN